MTRTAGTARRTGTGRTTGTARSRTGSGVGRTAAAALALATAVGLAAPGAAAAREGRGNPLEGVWRTEGYGLLIAVSGGRVTTYDVTAHSCLPGWVTGTQASEPGPDGTTRYTVGNLAMTLTPKGRNRAVEREESGVGTKSLTRLDALPPLCARPAPNDPLAVFDRFWEDFEENYPFFAAKGIDWHAVRDEKRPTITPATTADRLQDVFTDMLGPLGDAHTGLARVVDGHAKEVFGGQRPDSTVQTPELTARALQASAAQLTGPEQQFAGGRLGVGRLPDGLGYLRVSSFDGYTDGDFRSQVDELDRALDAVLAGPDRPTGLVVDVRLNGGGSDALGLHIAARLTDRPYVAYRKVARNDPADPTKFTRPEPITVRPSAGGHFTGPVAVLTSSISTSAAETFTQAMTGRSPQVLRVGENTQGVFSDIMIKSISPDFMAVLPNEKYLTRNGGTFDGPGIPPDVRTPVFTPDELAALRDSALSTARRMLTEDAQGNQSSQGDHGNAENDQEQQR
ncbi:MULTISPECIES: S41 family peptidase [Streptomycetaceae]|uniref:S41 family peptidase n=1 Tax=Streptomycetaceae TaxID=2062 RepID=UPI0009A23415|nr:S41 family peptidase [Streptomyces sp. CB02056]